MKKTLLILALAFSLNISYAQRDIDWSVEEILMPTEIRSGAANTPIIVKVVCKNNSTIDAIEATDTLGMQVIIAIGNQVLVAYPSPTQIALTVVKKTCNPGDTIQIDLPLTYNGRIILSKKVDVVVTSEIFNRSTGLARELVETLANNTKKVNITWFCEQGWGVSVNDINKDVLSVYPNPASSNLTINLDLVGNNNSFEIYDMSGKLVKADALNNFDGSQEINVSEFSKGIYILKANNGSQIYTTKFIVE